MDNCNKSFHTQQSGFGEVELAARSCWDFFSRICRRLSLRITQYF